MSDTTTAPRKFKKIAIAGAGGLGSHLTAFLYDYGVNRNQFPFAEMEIDVYDDDTVDTKNLLHQNFSTSDLNKPKVKSLEDRYFITGHERMMTVEDFKKYDLIFSCVDSMVFRTELYKWSWENPKGAFWIDGRCESKTGCLFTKDVAKEELEKMLSESKERTGCLRAAEKAANISHLTPVIVAARMGQVFLNYTRGENVKVNSIFMV